MHRVQGLTGACVHCTQSQLSKEPLFGSEGKSTLYLEAGKALAMGQEFSQGRIHHTVCDVQDLHSMRPI